MPKTENRGKWNRIMILASVCALLLMAIGPLTMAVSASTTTVTVQPGETFNTDILDAQKGDHLDYYYNSTGEVRFTISQYQAGVEYNATSDSLVGTFTAPRDGSYIVQFENDGLDPVLVTYSIGEFESGAGLGLIFIVAAIIATIIVILGAAIVVRAKRSRLPKL